MIKRTGEVTLATIGLILGAILQGLFSLVSNWVGNITQSNAESSDFAARYESALRDANVSPSDAPDVHTVITGLHTFGTWSLIILIVTVIISVLGIYFIIGNKKPVLAGILFLVAAIVVLLATLFVGFIPAILLFIAALMSFIRKPRPFATL